MKTILLVCTGALALWGQCGPGQQLAPMPVSGMTCINTPQVVVGATALPQANLVAEYPLTEGYGAYAYNYASPIQPNYNLVGPSEQQFSASGIFAMVGVTTTDNYAVDPNGDFVASRLQATGTGGYLALGNGVTYIAGQQYTLSIYVASNTGAAQTIRMTDNNVNYGPNITVPATGWIRASYTFTASGTGTYVIPINQDAAGDHLDILIWAVQLEIGAHPTTYVPQVYQMVNGGGPQTSAHQCAWMAAGIDCTVHSGNSYMIAAGWQPIDLSVVTVYAAVKWTGTNVLAGYAPIISDNYNTPHFYLTGQDSGLPFPRLRFNNLLAYAYGANLNDGNWHIIVGEYDGANISLYLDGAQLAVYNVGSSNPIQFSQLFLSNFANAAFWPGQIGYAALYSVLSVSLCRVAACQLPQGKDYPRMRRTEVRPICRRRAISALLTPARWSFRTWLAWTPAVMGRPSRLPLCRACAKPARTRSRRMSRSNSANTANRPAIARPAGVVRSRASVKETKPTPRWFSS
jgi:hypothetical protein